MSVAFAAAQPGAFREKPLIDAGRAGLSQHVSLLVVDDDRSVRLLLGRALAEDGVDIAEAQNADEAQMVAAERQLDVVIADVVMPGRSGIELRRALTHSHPRLPVVLISGYSPEQVAEFAARTPATSFLPKPFTIAALRQVVSDALAGRAFAEQGL